MKRLQHKNGFLVVLALLAGFVPGVQAQLAVTTATLSGSVTDSSGAVVPQATVDLTSTQNGIARHFVTDGAGHYLFTQLPPATYTLSIPAHCRRR